MTAGRNSPASRDLAAAAPATRRRGAAHLRRGRRSSGIRARTGITLWDFGDLPRAGEIHPRRAASMSVIPRWSTTARPSTCCCSMTADEAERESRRGVVRLLRIALAGAVQTARQGPRAGNRAGAEIPQLRQRRAAARGARSTRSPTAHCWATTTLPRSEKAFDKQKERAKPQISVVSQALLRDVAEMLDLHAQVAARLNAKPQFTA